MKPFDLAIQYLTGLHLSVLDLHSDPKTGVLNSKEKEMLPVIVDRLEKFINDPDNRSGNGHSRAIVFSTATMHLAFKQQGHISFFDVACEIVEANKNLPKDCEKFMNTEYPLKMLHEWNDYCATKPEFPSLREGSDVRYDFFYTAYHYIIDEK